MRGRGTFVAPLALAVLVCGAAAIALLAMKALPASAGRAPAAQPIHVHGSAGYYRERARMRGTAGLEDPNLPSTAYSEPHVISSHNGVLRVTFKPHVGSAIVNGQRVYGMTTFTGTYPGPTLKLRPGDTLRMRFVNRLNEDTNLHFHGFRVSPSGLADNVLRTIAPAVTSKKVKPKKSVRIVVHIPKDHEQGLYWYHPHLHGLVDGQVYPGLEGLIVIGDVLRQFPRLDHIKRR